MYSYSQQSRCFWNGYNAAWPYRPEPITDRTVLTTAVCRVKVLRLFILSVRDRTGAYRLLVERPEGKRPLERPSRRWENNIKMNLQEDGWGHEMH